MPREIGPVIVMPGPDGDGHRKSLRRMKALKIEQARRTSCSKQLLDTVLPDSPERRELAVVYREI